MNSQRLSWRIGLPFALFVLAGSVALVLIIGWNMARDERARFEQLAHTNADFINHMKLPPSPRMSQELTQVLGVSVFFRKDHVLTPEAISLVNMDEVPNLPADGKCHVLGTREAVIVPLESGQELVLVRSGFAFRSAGW